MGEALHGRPAGALEAHEGAVLAVRFSRSGAYALTGGKDRTVRLWNPHRGLLVRTYEGHGKEVRDCAASGDSARLASVGGDRQVFLWDVARGATLRRFRGHESEVNACVFAGAGDQLVVTGGYDRAVRVWDCRSGSFDAVQSVVACRDSVTGVRATADALLACSVDGTVVQLDLRAGRRLTDALGPPVTCLQVSRDERCLLAGCLGGTIALVDRASGALLAQYTGHAHTSARLDCCLTHTDAHVVGGSEDGRVLYWDLVSREVVREFKAHTGAVCSMAWHPEGAMLLTASVDGSCRVWKGEGGSGRGG